MKIIYNSLIPAKRFLAVNLFGLLFIRKENKQLIESYPERYVTSWNHEAIHTAQMQETLYVGFYLLYFLFWIFRILTAPWKSAYKDISFEQEAYLNQDKPDYLKTRQPYAWLSYCFLTFKESQENQLF